MINLSNCTLEVVPYVSFSPCNVTTSSRNVSSVMIPDKETHNAYSLWVEEFNNYVCVLF